MKTFLITGFLLGVMAISGVFGALGVANTVYIANAGPNWIALRPSGYIRTNRGWSTVRDEHPVVYQGIYPQMYAVVTSDGSVYLVNTWNATPWVLAEIRALCAAQKKIRGPSPTPILLAQGTHP